MKKWIGFLAGCMLMAALSGCENAGSEQIEKLRKEGAALYKEENFQKAIPVLEEALELSGPTITHEDLDTLVYLADSQNQLEKNRDALTSYAKLIKLEPECIYFYYERGKIYMELSSYSNAARDFSKVLQAERSNYEQTADMYLRLYHAGAYEVAQDFLNQIAGDHYDGHMTNTVIQMQMGQYENALVFLEKAKLLRENKDQLLYEAYCQEGLEDYEAAEALYKEYGEIYGRDARVMNQQAVCLYKQGEYTAALSAIQEALTVADEAAKEALLWNEIITYEKMESYDMAKIKLQEFLVLYPEDLDAQLELEYLMEK